MMFVFQLMQVPKRKEESLESWSVLVYKSKSKDCMLYTFLSCDYVLFYLSDVWVQAPAALPLLVPWHRHWEEKVWCPWLQHSLWLHRRWYAYLCQPAQDVPYGVWGTALQGKHHWFFKWLIFYTRQTELQEMGLRQFLLENIRWFITEIW